ncbi:hypothetical protein NS228_25725 [Methylobacterium indicum]|uniref:hypothetical protein n=1 Tax=Methylobacterium indicum TaxID=1775910 RepID=UPI00073505C9|nr:hypothetical protein [Methylobacterium indicum]KTS25030.1 hypothetical protein NS229_20680 [Methylobacterium indicum]KTS25735.1 hypothetical protein NS228_25725 [Methylobacterium indicum]KTS44576.1 hypothetical protein NS230_25195 [Methylobacterium indicum]
MIRGIRLRAAGLALRLLTPALLGLASCTATRAPAPIRPEELGATFTPAARASAGTALFEGCRGPEAEAAQVVVSGWFDVVTHVDACDVAAARYYAGSAMEQDIAARLDRLGAAGEASCRVQARTVLARIRAANRQVAAWIPHAVPTCSLATQRDAAAAERDRLTMATRDIRCRIRRDFPELPGGAC